MKFSIHFAFFILILLLGAGNSFGQTTYSAGFLSGTGGSYNVHVGYYTAHLSAGSNNSFLGSQAGAFNSLGNFNSFMGSAAGYYNQAGSNNSFLGAYAGFYNTSGNYNSFIGSNAGVYNIGGSYNSFLGSYSGYSNKIGANNTFTGYRAGYATTSSNNTFIGKGAGEKNTAGGVNTFVGSEAGYNNVNGYHNVFMGRSTGQYNSSGYENTFLGNSAGSTNTTGNKNIALGYLAGPSVNNLTNATAIGHRARVNISNALVLGSINGINGATADTKVGIRTNSPAYNLHVNGTVAKPGGGSWTAASDKRLKQNIKDFTEGLTIIEQIRPVSFRYNGKAGLPTDKEYVGVIAQEMQKIAPYMVGEFSYQDSTGAQEKYLDYDATALTYMLVNAVKEVDQKYATQLQEKEAQIEQLQQELASIKALLIKYIPQAENQQARLGQNIPNPTRETTSIAYQLPQSAGSAFIKVYSSIGQEVKSFTLIGKTNGEVIIQAGMLAAGTYVYSLFVDGTKIDSKKLVLTP
jgi:trimeric autotransporter adhesin